MRVKLNTSIRCLDLLKQRSTPSTYLSRSETLRDQVSTRICSDLEESVTNLNTRIKSLKRFPSSEIFQCAEPTLAKRVSKPPSHMRPLTLKTWNRAKSATDS